MRMTIEKFVPAQLESAVAVLASAFVTNPLHIAAFGHGEVEQNRRFFRIGLEHMFTGDALVAFVDGKLNGYIHFTPSPFCLPPPDQIPALAESLFKPLGQAVPSIVEWFSTWSELDPPGPHVHLGPLAVAPDFQGRRVGAALMNRYVEFLDDNRAAGYLETDRPENVEFYKKFGFAVAQEQLLLGTRTWYMIRGDELE